MFAGGNSDTWMRPVRLLIRDSAPPLSPHLEGERSRRTRKHVRARIQALKAAGGHYQPDKSKQAKATPAHWMEVEGGRKYF